RRDTVKTPERATHVGETQTAKPSPSAPPNSREGTETATHTKHKTSKQAETHSAKPTPLIFSHLRKQTPSFSPRPHPPKPTPPLAVPTQRRSHFPTHITFAPTQAHNIRSTITKWLHEKDILLTFGETDVFHDTFGKRFAEVINTTSGNTRYNQLKIIEDTGD